MPWKANKKLVSQGLGDLEYLPRERCGWDNTLACLAFGMRMDIERRTPDLNAWADTNINILTDDKPPYNREMGSSNLRGILCKVYRQGA